MKSFISLSVIVGACDAGQLHNTRDEVTVTDPVLVQNFSGMYPALRSFDQV